MKAALFSRSSIDMDTMLGILGAPSAATGSIWVSPTAESGLVSAFLATGSPTVYGATAHIAVT